MVAAGKEDERARGRARRPTECQHAANKDEMVAAVVQGVALTLEMGQSAWNERHTSGTSNRLEARPLAASRLGEPCGQPILCLTKNADAPRVCCLPSREA